MLPEELSEHPFPRYLSPETVLIVIYPNGDWLLAGLLGSGPVIEVTGHAGRNEVNDYDK